jgi:hypothetical protein
VQAAGTIGTDVAPWLSGAPTRCQPHRREIRHANHHVCCRPLRGSSGDAGARSRLRRSRREDRRGAKTAAEHEAIAACYDGFAKDAQAKANEHKAMGAAYRKGGGPAVGKLGLPQHCDHFTKTFHDEAKMYEEMAKAHRQMAKNAR